MGFEPTVTLPPQWFSRASVRRCPGALLAGLSAVVLAAVLKIIPRISRVPFGALAACVGGILIVLGLAFRLGILLAFVIALVNAISVARYVPGLYPKLVPIEIVVILICLAFIGPGKYSVDKG